MAKQSGTNLTSASSPYSCQTQPRFVGKITESGQPCRNCKTPVVRRTHTRLPQPGPAKSYYFEYWFRCPGCFIIYLVETAKRYFDQRKPQPSGHLCPDCQSHMG